MTKPLAVLLVDDHPLFRQALAATVRELAPDTQLHQCETMAAARTLLAETGIDLVLLDLKLPDCQGMAGFLALKAGWPDLPIAVISANDDLETIQTAQACGAAGFVSKAIGLDQLTQALDGLLGGQPWFGTRLDGETGALTAMQARILDGVHRGLMNKQIAWETGLSEATVKYHLTGLFRKFGVQTRAQLLALARE